VLEKARRMWDGCGSEGGRGKPEVTEVRVTYEETVATWMLRGVDRAPQRRALEGGTQCKLPGGAGKVPRDQGQIRLSGAARCGRATELPMTGASTRSCARKPHRAPTGDT